MFILNQTIRKKQVQGVRMKEGINYEELSRKPHA